MKQLLIIVALLGIVIISCSKEEPTPPALDCSTPKSFASDVLPIFESSCSINSSCHAAGSLNGPGGLTTYSQIFTARSAIRTAVFTRVMPQNSTLTNEQINAIVCWIDNGAPNN